MRVGVLTFGYDQSKKFSQDSITHGFFTTNLGDNMQTIAMRYVLAEIGIPEKMVVNVNRDTLSQYDGEPVALIMNGCFYNYCFPIPAAVTPIFIGFEAKEPVIKKNRDYLKKHEPIGCRDVTTMQICQQYGVDAYVTGCMTLAMPKRESAPENGKVFLVYGAGAGQFPSDVLRYIPRRLLGKAEMLSQRLISFSYPQTEKQMISAEVYAKYLFETYSKEAALVVTPLHHAAAPCMAAGIPVILCREKMDSRFSFLESITPIYLPSSFAEINWNPAPIDLDKIKARLIQEVRTQILTKVDMDSDLDRSQENLSTHLLHP